VDNICFNRILTTLSVIIASCLLQNIKNLKLKPNKIVMLPTVFRLLGVITEGQQVVFGKHS